MIRNRFYLAAVGAGLFTAFGVFCLGNLPAGGGALVLTMLIIVTDIFFSAWDENL